MASKRLFDIIINLYLFLVGTLIIRVIFSGHNKKCIQNIYLTKKKTNFNR